MATLKQIEANRRNARRSTGPRTPAGKAAMRQNGVRHGLTSTYDALPESMRSEVLLVAQSLRALHNPVTDEQEQCIEPMALAYWRMNRVVSGRASLRKASDKTQGLYRQMASRLYRRALHKLELLKSAA